MKKMFVAVLLASASFAACSGKKASTTPQTSPENAGMGSATGGAAYAGHKPAAPATTPANPCAGK
jgi:hypothetical protein